MLSEWEIRVIEERYKNTKGILGADVSMLITERAELAAEIERMKKMISTLKAKISLGLRYECCETCKHSSSYGCVGDRYCRILGEYFTGNVKPPYKTAPDDCPMTVCETAIKERDRLQAENEAMKRAIKT